MIYVTEIDKGTFSRKKYKWIYSTFLYTLADKALYLCPVLRKYLKGFQSYRLEQ